MVTSEQINDTIERYVAAFRTTDRAGYLALFTDDATVEDPAGSDVKQGAAGIAEFWDFIHELSTNIELRPHGPVCAAPPEAAFPIQIVNDFGGTKMVLDAIDVMVFADDGRITSMRAFWDMAAMRPLDGD